MKGNGPSAVFDASVKSSYLWNHFQLLSLSQPIRDAQDITYSKWVDSIGEGSPIQPVTIVNMHHFHLLTSYQEAIHFLFPPEILLDPIKAIERCYLSPYNMIVDEFNQKIVEQIHSSECRLLSVSLGFFG